MKTEKKTSDADIIHALGGPLQVARRLGFTQQRVHNWLTRGIPARVKLDHPELFPAEKAA